MDLSYLLELQEFRNGVGGIFTEFLSKMTYLGEMSTTLIIMAIIYWCISKDFGTYLFMGFSGNRLVNGALKVTACAYRPWVRDAAIVPDATAKVTATGYSFPSGHTMNGASLFGGIAIRKEVPRALRIVTGIVTVFIGFSRNFLGVHTPQDVLVGLIAGLLMMWLSFKLMNRIEEHPEKDIQVALIYIAIAIIVVIYAAVKPYPVDYDAEGKLLVDGAKMANDTFKGAGFGIGFIVGWILERRFAKFSTDISMAERVTRLGTGVFSYYVVSLILMPLLKSLVPGKAGIFTVSFLQTLFITFIFPWFISRQNKN